MVEASSTKLMDGLFNYLLDGGWKGKIEKTCGKKKLVPQLGIEPLPFTSEASALTTEPS